MAVNIKHAPSVTVTAKGPQAQKVVSGLLMKEVEGLTVKVSPPKAKTAIKAKTEAQTVAEAMIANHIKLEESGAFLIFKEYELQKKRLSDIATTGDKDQEYIISCDAGDVVFSAKKSKTEIVDKPGLIKAMGQKTFMEIAKVTLGDAGKYLSEIELSNVTSVSNELGPRTLKAVLVKKVD